MTNFAIIFPGQGSQKVGMLSKLAKHYSIVEKTFSEASNILGYNLWKCVQEGPSEKLNKTCYTQPALLSASVAIWRIWNQLGGKHPKFLAGHSLGEYSALVCSGSINFTTAIKIIKLRSEFMKEITSKENYSMYVIIGLNKKTVEHACKQGKERKVVYLTNFNSLDQIVVAGHKKEIKYTCFICKKLGAKRILKLPVNVLSHCILMKPAAIKLEKVLENIKLVTPKIPIINNVDVKIEDNPKAIRKALVRQLYNPVRWAETIEYFSSHGIKELLELGPGKVLTKLTKRTVNTIFGIAINDPTSLSLMIQH